MAKTNIRSPKSSAYWYESTPEGPKLLLTIPESELKRRVKAGTIDKSILEDFPDGIDIPVNEEEFKEFNDVYGLKIPHNPRDILFAFKALYLQCEKRLPATGFLKTSFIQNLARHLKKDPVFQKLISMDLTSKKSLLSIGPGLNVEQLKKLEEHLGAILIEGFDKKKKIEEQDFSDIPMKGSVSPADVFASLAHNTK